MLDGLLRRYFGKGESRSVAKKRLRLALIYDKVEVSEDLLMVLQGDIVDVISRYFEIDKESLKLNIERSDDLSALIVSTPILRAKRMEKLTSDVP